MLDPCVVRQMRRVAGVEDDQISAVAGLQDAAVVEPQGLGGAGGAGPERLRGSEPAEEAAGGEQHRNALDALTAGVQVARERDRHACFEKRRGPGWRLAKE